MTDLKPHLIEEARKLAVDTLYSEKGHFAAAQRWRTAHLWLGIPASLLAAAAGAAFFEGTLGQWFPGLLAFGASALSAISTFLNCSSRATQHQLAGVQYGKLRRRIRQFVQVQAKLADADEVILAKSLTELTEEVGKTQSESPPIPPHAAKTAIAEIARGSANYTDAELLSAAGDTSE